MVDRFRPRLAWGCLGVGAACLLTGCIAVGGVALWLAVTVRSLASPSTPMPTAAQAVSAARITLPASARDLHAHESRFFDHHSVRVRFAMDPGDLPAFWAGTRIGVPPSAAVNPFARGERDSGLAWWTPHQTQRFQTGESSRGGVQQKILVDTTDSAVYIVFVSLFESF